MNGFVIPEGHGIVYISHTSNRDPSVFKDPDSFRPERWRNELVTMHMLLISLCCYSVEILMTKVWFGHLVVDQEVV